MIFLAADAFGVLPPVSRLTTEQMQYHFPSGFTSKLAGTERGITQPTPTFRLLWRGVPAASPDPVRQRPAAKMAESGAEAWLVNTGWNGEGQRLSLRDTRSIISAILNGTTGLAARGDHPVFGLCDPAEHSGGRQRVLIRVMAGVQRINGRRRPRARLSCLADNFQAVQRYAKRVRVWRWPVRSCRRARSKPDPRPAGRRLAPTCWRAALLRKAPAAHRQ